MMASDRELCVFRNCSGEEKERKGKGKERKERKEMGQSVLVTTFTPLSGSHALLN